MCEAPNQHTVAQALALQPKFDRHIWAHRHHGEELNWLLQASNSMRNTLRRLPPDLAEPLREALSLGIDPENLPDDYDASTWVAPSSGPPPLPSPEDYPAYFAELDMARADAPFTYCTKPPSDTIPHLMHTIWLGSVLPERDHACFTSFAQHNPTYTQLLWTDLPPEAFERDHAARRLRSFCREEGVRMINVNDVAMPILLHHGAAGLFMQQMVHRQYGGASDVLRYALLLHFGGLYVDADRRCLNPLARLHEYTLVAYRSPVFDIFEIVDNIINPWGGRRRVPVFVSSNDFIMCAPGHEAMTRTLKHALIAEPAHAEPHWRAGIPVRRQHCAVLTVTGPAALVYGISDWLRPKRANYTFLENCELDPWPWQQTLAVATRRNDWAWTTPPSRQRQEILYPQSPATQRRRGVTCALDDFRQWGTLDLRCDSPVSESIARETVAQLVAAVNPLTSES